MLEKIPIISFNVKIWKILALIQIRSWRSKACIIACAVVNLFQLLYFFATKEAIEMKIVNAFFLVLWFNAVLRGGWVDFNCRDFENFMAYLGNLYFDIEENGDEYIKEILRKSTKRAHFLSVVNLVFAFFVDLCFITYPLVTSVRVLPYGFDIPGIDVLELPYYLIIYILQALLTPVGCCLYIPFSNIVVAYMIMGVVLAKNLQHKIDKAINKSDSEAAVIKNLSHCIDYHLKIIRYTKDANSLVTYVCLVEFVSFGALLCALLFLLNIVTEITQICMICAYITMILANIFLLYWYANELLVENLNIAEAAYNAPWFNHSKGVRRFIFLLILRSRRDLTILMGNTYPITLQMFQSLLNISYKYFTLLRQSLKIT